MEKPTHPFCLTALPLGVAATLFTGAAVAAPESTPPNIVVILADDMGWMDLNAFATHATGVPKDRSANGTSASVGRAGRIMRSIRRS